MGGGESLPDGPRYRKNSGFRVRGLYICEDRDESSFIGWLEKEEPAMIVYRDMAESSQSRHGIPTSSRAKVGDCELNVEYVKLLERLY